jgi:hypothetical protein
MGHPSIWELRCGPVFDACLTHGWYGSATGWRVSLNGQDMGVYGGLEFAKARAQWEIWNRWRQAIPAYEAIMARQDEWKHGGGNPPAPRVKIRSD